MRRLLRGERAVDLDARTRSGRTALELVTVPGAWAPRSLVNAEVARMLRAAPFLADDPTRSWALASASFRRNVMPNVLRALSFDLSDKGGRLGRPGHMSPRILAYVGRDAFELDASSGIAGGRRVCER